MSRTNKQIPPTIKTDEREKYKIDEKGIKTAGQKRDVRLENRRDRHEAAIAANIKEESNDFPTHHHVRSEFTRSF